MINFRPFGDRLEWVSILVLKRLDLRPVLDVHFGRKGFGYLDLRERPINLYLVLSSYWKTKYGISGHLEIVWNGFQYWNVNG